MADALGRALLGIKDAGPASQLPQFAAQLLQFHDAHLKVGCVALQQVADMGAGGLAVARKAMTWRISPRVGPTAWAARTNPNRPRAASS